MRTEKEKMLSGGPYDCGDTELITRWHLAKQLQKEYNNTPNVWIGGGSIILPGVNIGDSVTIGCVVTHDIPSYSVAVGNPCRVIKTMDAGGILR